MNASKTLFASFIRGKSTKLSFVNITQWSSVVAKTVEWDKAMTQAEKIVGYSTSYFSLRCLLSDEISNIAIHLQKLVGTNHPLLETAKRLTYTGHSSMQTRGLIVLLMSKAAGHPTCSIDYIDAERSAGISQRQRSLAEMTEMIYSANLIHRGILNLKPNILLQSKTARDLNYGNKMSVLSGDFLLASVWKGLGELRDTKVVELMATAIGDSMEGQFIVETEADQSGIMYTEEYWKERNFLRLASLQANSCQSALALANYNDDLQQKAFDFGKNISLALQASLEIQPFLEDYNMSANSGEIDLLSAPVIFNNLLTNSSDAVNIDKKKIDYKAFHSMIQNGPGIEETRRMIRNLTDNALSVLDEFHVSDATKALQNLAFAIRDV